MKNHPESVKNALTSANGFFHSSLSCVASSCLCLNLMALTANGAVFYGK
ncbi:MAG: hypothetical protein FWF81_04805 [Defluviitaleaceae bacterium]|nr:hypothetical protein [Defluviitaleaceae bacterium]